MLYIFIFALAFILFDQGSKYYIVEKMTLGQSSEIYLIFLVLLLIEIEALLGEFYKIADYFF